MTILLECVPNVSEGRDAAKVKRIAQAFTSAGGTLLDVSSEAVVREFAGQFFERPRAAWNGEAHAIAYQQRTDNDGSSLYQPWLSVEGSFGSLSALPLAPGSYVPANGVVATTGANFVSIATRSSSRAADAAWARLAISNGRPKIPSTRA